MFGTGQDPTLLIVTNVTLAVICALFLAWVLAAIACEVIQRWRTRAALPQGWPPDGEVDASPLIPEAWPPGDGKLKRDP